MMKAHTIKYTHDDGEELKQPVYWCGVKSQSFDWSFLDAQHLALASGGSVAPCKNCVRAIIKVLSEEL